MNFPPPRRISSVTLAATTSALLFLTLSLLTPALSSAVSEPIPFERFGALSDVDFVTSDVVQNELDFSSLFAEHVFQDKPSIGISRPSTTNATLLLQNGSTSVVVTFAFRPPTGLTIEDYEQVNIVDNENVIVAADIAQWEVSGPELLPPDNLVRAYNFSVTMDFAKFPGTMVYNAQLVPRDGVESETFTSPDVDVLVGGFVIYNKATNTILSGEDNLYSVPFQSVTGAVVPFDVFVQYLDGRTSNTSAQVNQAPLLDDMTISLPVNQINLDNAESCQPDNGNWTGTTVALPTGCGLGFASETVAGVPYPGLKFGLRLKQNRAGRLVIDYNWPQFTDGFPEFEEGFATVFNVEVTGTAPIVITAITPAGPFSQDGGELINVDYFNGADSTNRRFIVVLPNGARNPFPEVRRTFDEVTGTYRSVFTVQAGSGSDLDWYLNYNNVDGVASNATEIPYTFSYIGPPSLSRLNPNIGTGGEIIVAIGSFFGLAPSNGRDGLYFNGIRLPDSFLNSFSGTSIFFNLPQRQTWINLGSGTNDYWFNVVVQVDDRDSPETVYFYYNILPVLEVIITGGSPPVGGVIEVSVDSTEPIGAFSSLSGNVLGPNNVGPTYLWTLRRSDNTIVPWPASVNATAPSIEFDVSVLDSFDVFTIDLVVTPYAPITGVVRSSTPIRKTTDAVISIQIYNAGDRSRGIPNSGMFFYADVTFSSGTPDSLVLYTWTYRGVEYTASSESVVVDQTALNTTGVLKYGREFYVPQEEIVRGTATASLTVSSQALGISATSSSSLLVFDATLVPIINQGGSDEIVSSNEGLNMFSENSYDPDILVVPDEGPRNANLETVWLNCTRSAVASFAPQFTFSCDNMLIGRRNLANFTVEEPELLEYMIDGVLTWFRFTMRVTDGNRISPATTSVVVVERETRPAVKIDDISMLYSQANDVGAAVDMSAVIYEAGIQINIVPSAAGSTWTYEVDAPFSERNLIDEGFQSGAGNYNPNAGPNQNSPLVLRSGQLLPSTTYRIRVLGVGPPDDASVVPSETVVEFRTIAQVQFVFGPVRTTGTTGQTVFSTAGSQTNANPSTTKFYYKIYDVTNPTSVFCVGACTGDLISTFTIFASGTYRLKVVIRDSLGISTLLDVEYGSDIVVSESTARRAALAALPAADSRQLPDELTTTMIRCFLAGDDKCVTSVIFSATANFEQGTPSQDERRFVQTAAVYLEALSQNDIPNSDAGDTLMLTAAELACTGPLYIDDLATVQQLLSVSNAISTRTPIQFQVDTFDQLIPFFNCTPTVANSLSSGGSSRRRLLQDATVNNALLDVYELQSVQIPVAAVSGTACGFEGSFSTANTALSLPSGDLAPSVVVVSTQCNTAQVAPLTGGFSTFEVCEGIFDNSQKRFSLFNVETPDYVFLAGARPQVGSVGLSNIGALSPNTLRTEAGCYTVSTDLRADDQQSRGFIYTNVKEVGVDFTSTNFEPSYSGITSTVSNSVLSSTLDDAGLFGGEFQGLFTPAPTDSQGDRDSGLSAGAIAGIVIGALVGILLLLLLLFLLITRCCVAAEPLPIPAGFDYVERDIYGRGFVVGDGDDEEDDDDEYYEDGDDVEKGSGESSGEYETESASNEA